MRQVAGGTQDATGEEDQIKISSMRFVAPLATLALAANFAAATMCCTSTTGSPHDLGTFEASPQLP